MEKKKLVIIGGVAGGASCAARARRMSEQIEIILLDRGPYVSFANCGLPYYVGNVIEQDKVLLVATPELFRDRFHIEVRIENEVLSINPETKTLEIKELASGHIYTQDYDALLLSPGAAPIRPPLPGIELPGIFALRTIPDSRAIKKWIAARNVSEAVVVGGGFIGLEMAENLAGLDIRVTLVEAQAQLLAPFDPEMACYLSSNLKENRVDLYLEESVIGFEQNTDNSLNVCLKNGSKIKTGLVLLGIGVKPESGLAKTAGLELGKRGGIRVNELMQTSDSSIWAVGDVVEVLDYVTGEETLVPLAGPANRQGRIAADIIVQTLSDSQHPSPQRNYRGTQGTSICQAFDLVAACTGINEKTLKHLARTDYEKVYLHPGHHVNYYPGAKPIHLKLLFSVPEGKILGAQAIGEQGIEKRIDTLAMAIQLGGTVFDLEEAELCYAPQFGAAKDPVNLAGMIAANMLRGEAPLGHWEDILTHPEKIILDVRDSIEYTAFHLPNAINIPLHQIRDRMKELPKDKEIWVHCGVGQRSYYAVRTLRQYGYDAKNLSGGLMTFQAVYPCLEKKNKVSSETIN